MRREMDVIVFSIENFMQGEVFAVNALLAMDPKIRFHLRKPRVDGLKRLIYIDEMSVASRKQTVFHGFDVTSMITEEVEAPDGSVQLVKPDVFKEVLKCQYYSAHSTEEILANPGYDYYFLSPIYDSISKEGYKSAFSKTELTEFLHAHPEIKVMALGGMTADKVDECREMGFAGVAFLGEIWNAYRNGGVEAMTAVMQQILDAAK